MIFPFRSNYGCCAVCNIVLNSIGTILFECCHDFFVAFLHERHKSPFFSVPFFLLPLLLLLVTPRVLHIVFVFVRFFLSRKLYTFDILIGQAANQNSNNCSSSSFSKSKNSNNELIRYKRLLHRSGCGGGNSDDDSHDISSSSSQLFVMFTFFLSFLSTKTFKCRQFFIPGQNPVNEICRLYR